MGWSCTKAAADVLDAISNKCDEGSNSWSNQGAMFFYEQDMIEHGDGAITGEVMEFDVKGRCHSVGKFRIEPDGRVSSFPRLRDDMRKAAEAAGPTPRAAHPRTPAPGAL